ncbi:MAG: class I SAM-dependent methyltransferase [Candidatus Thorarchaeota archaeon]
MDSQKDLRHGYEGIGEFYDLFASNDDIPFYIELAKQQGSPILDIAAGSCRVSIELAREGFEVWALEKSPSMLSAAKKKLQEAPSEISQRVTLVEGDMSDFSLDEKFPLVIIPASFGHALTTEEQLSTLRCIKDHIQDDGLFVLDLYTNILHLDKTGFKDAPANLPDGRIVTRSGKITVDMTEQLMRIDLTYHVTHIDGNEETIQVSSGAAVIGNKEADHLLRLTGLQVEKEFGGYDRSRYTTDSGRRILLLRT